MQNFRAKIVNRGGTPRLLLVRTLAALAALVLACAGPAVAQEIAARNSDPAAAALAGQAQSAAPAQAPPANNSSAQIPTTANPPAGTPATQKNVAAKARKLNCRHAADPNRRRFGCKDEAFEWEDTLTRDWFGVRAGAQERGITLTASYYSALQTNAAGGTHQVWGYVGQFTGGIDFDFEKILHVRGMSLYFSHYVGSGSNLSGTIGSVFPVTTNLGVGSHLGEIYLQQKLDGGNLTLAAGRLAASYTFAAWEHFAKAVLDYFKLDAVDWLGASCGGYLALRAAAFEPRIKHVVSLPASYWGLDMTLKQCTPGQDKHLLSLFKAGDRAGVDALCAEQATQVPCFRWCITQGQHITGTTNAFDCLTSLNKHNLEGVLANVKQDVLLTEGEDDHLFNTSWVYRIMSELVCARSVATRIFTAREGAQMHCQVGNSGLARMEIVRWLAKFHPGMTIPADAV
jgi:hypothetical protein